MVSCLSAGGHQASNGSSHTALAMAKMRVPERKLSEVEIFEQREGVQYSSLCDLRDIELEKSLGPSILTATATFYLVYPGASSRLPFILVNSGHGPVPRRPVAQPET
jgi:hypothetical protein